MTLRSRSLPIYGYGPIKQNTYVNGVLSFSQTFQPALSGYQQTFSSGSAFPLRNGRFFGELRKLDLGTGGFITQSAEWSMTPGYAHVRSSGFVSHEHIGNVFAQTYQNSMGPSSLAVPKNGFEMDSLGTIGISRALPTNPLSGMGQFLGELREGLPRLPDYHAWKDLARDFRHGKYHNIRSRAGKKAADEYLNGVFGWAPFVKDLKDFAGVVQTEAPRIQQYARDSGNRIRRHAFISDSSTTSTSVLGAWFGNPALPTDCCSSPGLLTKTTEVRTRSWFTGSFTYYLPDGDSIFAKALRAEALAHKLYGLRLDPYLVWQLTPWSWAADWVGNVGSVIHNWSAFATDGLVMNYGYVMAETVTTETWSGQNLRLVDGSTVSAVDRRITTTRQRNRATPYGFGLNPSTFSAKQWSIIAALGISRKPRSLN